MYFHTLPSRVSASWLCWFSFSTCEQAVIFLCCFSQPAASRFQMCALLLCWILESYLRIVLLSLHLWLLWNFSFSVGTRVITFIDFVHPEKRETWTPLHLLKSLLSMSSFPASFHKPTLLPNCPSVQIFRLCSFIPACVFCSDFTIYSGFFFPLQLELCSFPAASRSFSSASPALLLSSSLSLASPSNLSCFPSPVLVQFTVQGTGSLFLVWRLFVV